MFSFRLNKGFVEQYDEIKPDWGWTDEAGNSVGEVIFLRTYSREKEDGTKETWVEVCERVVNGMFSILKDHAKTNRLPWNDNKAHRMAEDAFDRLFNFKWTPPGRGLWMMGTPLVNEHKNSAALQNCAFVSTGDMTKSDPAGPFAFLMEASMHGIGVGFDADGAKKGFEVHAPRHVDGVKPEWYDVDDDREGWVKSVRWLLESYLKPDMNAIGFSYGKIRKKGEPIKTFGGVAAGPEPLMELHNRLRKILDVKASAFTDNLLDTRTIADIGNLIGVCVVSGNVRRSAELFIGDIWDDDFLNLKNSERFPERNAMNTGWGFMSNNSVAVNRKTDLSPVTEGIKRNGEPGVIWLDTTREYGRLADKPDGKDWRVQGFNPCAEQPLESYECCTLVETYMDRHEDYDDFIATLKLSYLYAKTVTLLPTHWEKTNAVMQRNRRIGASVSGVTNFLDNNSLIELREWLDNGFAFIRDLDSNYSEWLGVRESIRVTTVKPSGTVSLVTGSSPGVHWIPGGEFHIRRVTFDMDSPILHRLAEAGYPWEPSVYTEGSAVVEFPVHSRGKRSEAEVPLWEKATLAAELQRWWSDNSVSVTLSYHPEEAEQIPHILQWGAGNLKTASFLPMGGAYEQMVYETITEEEYRERIKAIKPIDMASAYFDGGQATGEAYCTTDKCELPV